MRRSISTPAGSLLQADHSGHLPSDWRSTAPRRLSSDRGTEMFRKPSCRQRGRCWRRPVIRRLRSSVWSSMLGGTSDSCTRRMVWSRRNCSPADLDFDSSEVGGQPALDLSCGGTATTCRLLPRSGKREPNLLRYPPWTGEACCGGARHRFQGAPRTAAAPLPSAWLRDFDPGQVRRLA